ncbi:hypothetical protein EVA_14915 [gut metagenome]|uniref:Uncharacterized protein n=1 Tax=gut metagenome TaxID=749906 RepID=J9CAM2_9ZZZZ
MNALPWNEAMDAIVEYYKEEHEGNNQGGKTDQQTQPEM